MGLWNSGDLRNVHTFKVSLAHFFLFGEEIKPVSLIHIYVSRTQRKKHHTAGCCVLIKKNEDVFWLDLIW